MSRHEITVAQTINATPAKVYEVISDIGRLGDWLPNVTKVTVTGTKKSGVGATRTVAMRMGNTDLQSHQRIVTAEPGKAFAWIHDKDYVDKEEFDLLTDVGTVFLITTEGKGAKLTATAHFEPKGIKAKLAAPLFSGEVKKQMHSALDNVRRIAEKK